jgi:hypothetical protein
MLKIVGARPDGIGTRLLTILYARQFADKMGLPFYASWPDLMDPHYKNDSLLTAESASELFIDGRLFKDKDVEWLHGEFTYSLQVARYPQQYASREWTKSEMTDFLSGFHMMVYDIPLPIYFAGVDKGQAANEIRRLWKQLNFSSDVIEAAEEIIGRLDMDQCVAAHVRRGDILNIMTDSDLTWFQNVGVIQVFQRYIPFQTVVDSITSKFSDRRSVLVCSEDPSIAARLQEALPGRQVITSVGAFQLGSSKAALLDQMLLSESRDIVAPFKSLFSECASTVGPQVNIHTVNLDVWNLVPELIDQLDKVQPPDIDSRKAVVYGTTYQNLLHYPDDDPFKSSILAKAREADPEICRSIIGF